MTERETAFFALLRAALHGETISLDLPADVWQSVFALAFRQHLLPMVYEAALASEITPELAPLFSQYRQGTIEQVARQAARDVDFRALYRYLRRCGLRPIVVKGQLCSRLYALRYHRISADNDLFISEAEFRACHRALAAYGLAAETLDAQLDQAAEITYRDRDNTLYIELHRALFDIQEYAAGDLNPFFADAFSQAVETDGYLSMPAHMHMLYLLLHAYKHFIYSGVGIRQTCDLALWAMHNAAEIDWPLLLEQCSQAHADRFAAAQFQIAEQYLEFRLPLPDCWREICVDPQPLLQDMLDGGVYGSDSLTRLHTSTVTLDAIRACRTGKKASVVRSVFPSYGYMAARIPWLYGRPLLLPAAWVVRIFHYAAELRRSDSSDAAESLRLAKARIALLKQYGVIS